MPQTLSIKRGKTSPFQATNDVQIAIKQPAHMHLNYRTNQTDCQPLLVSPWYPHSPESALRF